MTACRLLGVMMLLLAAQVAAAADAPSPTPGQPREQVEQILSGDTYQRWQLRQQRADHDSDSAIGEMFAAWRQWMKDQIDAWFDRSRSERAEPTAGGSSGALLSGLRVLGWVVVGLAVAFLCFVVIRTLRDREKHDEGARVLSRERVREALDAGEALALDAPEWLQEARRLQQDRDLRAMYRALYLALLSGLHKEQKINYRTNRTNWTYVRHYRGPEDERAVFHRLTTTFDEVWYGHHIAAAADVQQVERDVAMLIEDAGGAS
ncbi:MAG: DUF4129 domain-containing protein [Phycisphaeraceae bacterium]